jgi:hypothetical protein
MKILFICLSTLKFDVETPTKEPLGGTESAVAYLSVELAKLGHEVVLMCNSEEKILQGVKHRPVDENLDAIDPDVVIVTSAPQAIPAIQAKAPRAKVILWNHMNPDQPAMQPLFDEKIRAGIKHIVYVSENQKQTFKGIPGDVINNAIAPVFENMFTSAEEIFEAKQCRGVYTSTPYRGLAVLLKIQEMEIDVFSSMKVYQGNDEQFQPMYEKLKENDCIIMKGSVSQTELAKSMREIAFLVYPSIFLECHSIAILEAMAAGLKVVTTDLASPQTEFIDSMPNGGSVDDYAKMLRKNINFFRSRKKEWSEKMWQQVQYVNREFTWAKRAKEWSDYLGKIVAGVDDQPKDTQV